MGATISKARDKIWGTKEMRLLMLGLDAAGKTSMDTQWERWNVSGSGVWLTRGCE